MDEMFSRTGMLLGDQAIEHLQKKHVAVFGIGGVGGYVCEALVRSGVGALTIVDKDVVDITNINRQIIATTDTIGKKKVDVMADRLRAINPAVAVHPHCCFFLPETADTFDFQTFDYVVDAVDTVTAKLSIIEKAKRESVPVISAMGAGNKLDPGRFVVTDITKSRVCPLARVMRRELKERGIRDVKVVWSDEKPIKTGQRTPGSIAFVPAAAGLILSHAVIEDLIQEKEA